MVEILKALVDVLSRVAPALARRGRDKRLQDIGATLLMVYIRLNEIVVSAERIIEELEGYVEEVESNNGGFELSHAEAEHRNRISSELAQQEINLARTISLLGRNAALMVVLDDESYRQLQHLLSSKIGAVQTLMHSLHRRRLPIVTEYIEGGPTLLGLVFSPAIDTTQPLGREAFVIVKPYLEKRNPRVQLKEVKGAIRNLRAAIVESFSVEDLLLAAGDRRFGIDRARNLG
ncbi:hypothetical protein ACN26Z_18400 [Verrucosispora sp. WMMD703]|uniref:hypothetical protein n=1 Tax=Verrucosispora sp. WMMD703 TaxID=3403463 RepID=UPI003B94129D